MINRFLTLLALARSERESNMEYCTCHVAGCCGGVSKTLSQKIFRRTCTGQSCKTGMSPQNRGRTWGHRDAFYYQQEIHTCLTSDWQHSFSSSSVCQVRNLRMPREVNQFPKCSSKDWSTPQSSRTYVFVVDVGSMGKVYNHHPEEFLSLNWRGQFEERPFLQFYCGKIQLHYGPALRIFL